MSSTGPPRNYCGALKTNLKTCVKGTKLRVYTLAQGLDVSNFLKDIPRVPKFVLE